ncbi:Lysylphosphatidylglycerol synthetase/glycosyltransferase AglD [Actinobacteria bacterium OK074]|nr:Lysylphosphatidylglycerol synthetase/glycosyltransferase AglD [Actinobacteria bacterium OK074]
MKAVTGVTGVASGATTAAVSAVPAVPSAPVSPTVVVATAPLASVPALAGLPGGAPGLGCPPVLRFPRLPSASRYVRPALALFPLLLVAAFAALDWSALRDGAARLASANPWWLLLGVVFTVVCCVSSACNRQGAIPDRLPPGLLLASQFAAGAANHVLPASLGAHAVTLRFLQGRGIPLARATASLALYSLVRPIAKLLVTLAFVAAFPDVLRLGQLVPDKRTLMLAAGGVVAGPAATALVLTAVRPLRRPFLEFVRTALTDVRTLHTMPSRVLALWGGAAAFPVLQGCVLACAGASLGLPLPWTEVIFAYLAASAVAGPVPAPGGIGPVDAALVVALVVLGSPVALATATVIGYRVLTVWLPLLPGALVLSALARRKVL